MHFPDKHLAGTAQRAGQFPAEFGCAGWDYIARPSEHRGDFVCRRFARRANKRYRHLEETWNGIRVLVPGTGRTGATGE
jgi:hypothetical protein